MPNWSEGSLRLRGKKTDIICFLKSLETSDRDDWSYISNTRRAFVIDEPYTVQDSIDILSENGLQGTAVCGLHIWQAWGIDVKSFIEISQKYHLDIRIDTVECGMMFTEHYEIINGKVTEDIGKTYKTYEEFEWDVPYFFLGG